MSQPKPKPWEKERSLASGGSYPNGLNSSSSLSTSTNSASSPTLPYRPTTLSGSNLTRTYDSPYRSSYGGYGSSAYGGYGSGYGGYNSGYGGLGYGGGYGSSYGGYGGYGGGGYGSSYGRPYNRYGLGGEYPSRDSQLPRRGWFQTIEDVLGAFGRFTFILDSNFEALFGSFAAVTNLIEKLHALKQEYQFIVEITSLFAVIGTAATTFKHLYQKLSSSNDTYRAVQAGKPFEEIYYVEQKRKRSSIVFFVLSLAVLIGGPIILIAVLRKWARKYKSEDKDKLPKIRAKYDSQCEAPTDLAFSKGDIVTVLGKTEAPDWVEAELNGKTGLVPLTFFEPLEAMTKKLPALKPPPAPSEEEVEK